MANGSSGPSGIITRKYKSGSIIYFEGDKSEYIYILKAGRVILTSRKLDTGEEVKEDVRQGEFFGVKSALGKYPREETAQTVGETMILVFTLDDFEKLVLRNVNVVRKMLRVFSNQLRRIGRMVRSVLGEGENTRPDLELFRIGEYYYKAGVYKQAEYAYKKYMEFYPDSEHARAAMEKIKAISTGQVAPAAPSMDMNIPVSDDSGFDDVSDFDNGPGDFDDFNDNDDNLSDDSGAASPLSNEMDDFLSDDEDLESFDDFSFDDVDSGEAPDTSISKLYFKASDMFTDGQYDEALEIFKKIANSGDPGGEDRILYQNSHFEIGRCYLKIGLQKDAISNFSETVKKFPNTECAKNSLFHIGRIFEAAKQVDKARAYYSKVASIPPDDDLSSQARSRLNKL